MARIVSSERRRSLNTFLVEPRETRLGWDYGAPNERLSVWIVALSAGGEVALAYSAVGFGPDFRWGCVAVTADSCGMDPNGILDSRKQRFTPASSLHVLDMSYPDRGIEVDAAAA